MNLKRHYRIFETFSDSSVLFQKSIIITSLFLKYNIIVMDDVKTKAISSRYNGPLSPKKKFSKAEDISFFFCPQFFPHFLPGIRVSRRSLQPGYSRRFCRLRDRKSIKDSGKYHLNLKVCQLFCGISHMRRHSFFQPQAHFIGFPAGRRPPRQYTLRPLRKSPPS